MMHTLDRDSLFRYELQEVEQEKSRDFVSGIAGSSSLTFTGPNGQLITVETPAPAIGSPVSSQAAGNTGTGNANDIDISRVAAQRVNIPFDNGGVAPPANVFVADYQVPMGRVLVLDQVQYLLSPIPLMTLPFNTVLMSLAVNGNLVPNFNNVEGYPTDPFDCHLVVDENQHAQVIINYAFGGATFPLVRMFGRLYLKSTLPPDFLLKL